MSDFNEIFKHFALPNSKDELKQVQRLFHGRGHAYPHFEHVSIDWLSPVILITLFSPEPKEDIQKLSEFLINKIPQCTSIQVQYRHEMAGPIELVWGEEITDLSVLENNNRFQISLGKARNTGLFLDMKNGREWVQESAKDKRVLNLFSYTCGFSISAIEGGAKSVVNIDMSSPALNVGRENHRLNNHSLKKVRFEKLNIFKSFGRLKKRGPFDLLICDPPTLQKGSVDIERDYSKIMKRLDEFMAPHATLMLCLNAPDLNENFLISKMREYAPRYTATQIVKPPGVFKEAQGKGLKILIFTLT
jgi:23S rRNA (cytosine1962-C5)-methyltransferase